MNNLKTAAWLFSLLIGLACSGYYFAAAPKPKKLDAKTLSTMPDTIITHLRVTQYDDHGKLANRLVTAELQHIPHDDTHLLKDPIITVKQANQPDWHITSNHAKAVHGWEKITLIDKVIVSQRGDQPSQMNTMRTEKLIYYPQKKLAVSNVAVLFEQPGSVVHSQGMKAWLADKHIKLLSKPHATYKPNKA